MAVEKKVEANYRSDLIKIDPKKRIATFKHIDTGVVTTKPFDAMHVVPHMSPPEELKKSELANSMGFVDVDKETMQHVKYPNVFACGDSSNLPTSKTAAAITSQVPIMVHNLFRQMKGQTLNAKFDGYTSCPIFVGDNKLMLCEFLYGLNVQETFPWDQGEPSQIFFHMKKDFFPPVYWNFFVSGMWYGKRGWIPPFLPKD
eukprot:CAMPEP_0184302374 /NCGR_PEP_ID=MMETSP1049-20130417/12339_1 /TAXON_ID=77928 /ORGANISM="Proteomonas sulcata, Strain CCMP704" /LENGTH=200 /DNA_ID=CAMNT_0026613655 /DNA_START=186 /DNA_END=788 /DNA_ORIENTATION=+